MRAAKDNFKVNLTSSNQLLDTARARLESANSERDADSAKAVASRGIADTVFDTVSSARVSLIAGNLTREVKMREDAITSLKSEFEETEASMKVTVRGLESDMEKLKQLLNP